MGCPNGRGNAPADGKSVQSLSANSDLEAGKKDPRGQPSVCRGVDQVSPHLREDEFRRPIAVEVPYEVPVGQFRRFCREEDRGRFHENIRCWMFGARSQVGDAARREVDDLRTGKGVDIGEVEDDSIWGGREVQVRGFGEALSGLEENGETAFPIPPFLSGVDDEQVCPIVSVQVCRPVD